MRRKCCIANALAHTQLSSLCSWPVGISSYGINKYELVHTKYAIFHFGCRAHKFDASVANMENYAYELALISITHTKCNPVSFV